MGKVATTDMLDDIVRTSGRVHTHPGPREGLHIDTSGVSANGAAQMIVDHFGLRM